MRYGHLTAEESFYFENDAELQAGVAKWVAILNLEGWEICASLVKSGDLDSGKAASCWITGRVRAATIKILGKTVCPGTGWPL